MKRSIQKIVADNLCVGCGTCYSECPVGAITMVKRDVFVPFINADKCDGCGLCEFVCPGYHVDYKMFESKTVVKVKNHPLIGTYIDTYLGHARNRSVRFMGSSGGVITAVLMYALENEIIDGALVVVTNGINPMIIIARSSLELKEAMGSKYIPVPLNVGLKEILDMDGRFAFVGLPCHLLGLDRITILNPVLAKKIVLKLGLFCGRGFDYHYLHYILKDLGIRPASIRKIRFRGYGWPGKVFIDYVSKGKNKEVYVDYARFGRYSGSYLFIPKRCLFCPDHTAELADISFGDAWLKEVRKIDSEGTSIIVTRTATGNKILLDATRAGFINTSKSSVDAVVRSQYLQLNFHKISLKSRQRIARVLGVKTPIINIKSVRKERCSSPFFSVSLILTQIIYNISKEFGFSESFPKPIVRIWGFFHSLINVAESRHAMRARVLRYR